jgi:hypothetical protein
MLDFLTPLGRPPLDGYSPTQVIRTAEPVPAGVWEVELGSAVLPPVPLAGVGIRWGIVPGLAVDLGAYAPHYTGRRVLGVHYAPIPALWSVHAGVDPPYSLNASTGTLEVGSTLELALPFITPRLAPRFLAVWTAGPGQGTTYAARVAIGFETRVLRAIHLGGELDLEPNSPDPAILNAGIRFRIIDNIGGSVFGQFRPGTLAFQAGVLAAWRF